jgi:Crp-like helix-turn-helix protein
MDRLVEELWARALGCEQAHLFDGIPRQELEPLRSAARPEHVRPGTYLWKSRGSGNHRPRDAAILVCEGVIDEMRGEYLRRRISRGHFANLLPCLGELTGTIDLAAPRGYGTALQALSIEGGAFRAFVFAHARFRAQVLRYAAELDEDSVHALQVAKLEIAPRLANHLLSLAKRGGSFLLRFKHRELASIVRTTEANVARAMTKLRRYGALEPKTKLGFIQIRCLETLRRAADQDASLRPDGARRTDGSGRPSR